MEYVAYQAGAVPRPAENLGQGRLFFGYGSPARCTNKVTLQTDVTIVVRVATLSGVGF